MKIKTENKSNNDMDIHKFFFLLLVAGLLSACDMTGKFKQELDDIPQIDNSTANKYKAAYAVGDTLKITGYLYPQKGLVVRVGGVAAPIVKTEKIYFIRSDGGTLFVPDSLDRVCVIVTQAMGVGSGRSVQVELRGNVVDGSPIQIYTLGGNGGFTQALKLVTLYTFPANRRSNTFLHCINGKGEIYYFNAIDHQLHRIDKNGTDKVLLTEAQVEAGGTWTFNSTTPFLGGGVNPQATRAWFTVITSRYDYLFCEADLTAGTVKVLNSSTSIGPNYQGAIGGVNAVISGAFPDSTGKVYVKIGLANNNAAPEQGSSDQTVAVALYDSSTGQLKYLFKTTKAAADVPGKALNDNYYMGSDFRFYPEEAGMYLIQSYFYMNDFGGVIESARGVTLYNLDVRLQENSFYPGFGTDIIGPFTQVQSMVINTFGLLPMSGQRLLGLAGYDQSTSGFPKLLTIGFNQQQVYQYAPGTLDQGNNIFTSSGTQNEMLNYDEQGHVYMTANRRANIVKTAIR